MIFILVILMNELVSCSHHSQLFETQEYNQPNTEKSQNPPGMFESSSQCISIGPINCNTALLLSILLFVFCLIFYCRSKIYKKHERDCKKILNMSASQIKKRQIYAVSAGSYVAYSSFYNIEHIHYYLDYSGNFPQAWQARQNKIGQWIQVSCQQPKYWTEVIIQGRADRNQWVESIKIQYTLNGMIWSQVQNGRVFIANRDRTTKKSIIFATPIYARVIRVYPQTWYGEMSMRFEAVYIDLDS